MSFGSLVNLCLRSPNFTFEEDSYPSQTNITLGPELNSYFAAKIARKSWLNDTMQQLVDLLLVVRDLTLFGAFIFLSC